MLCKLVVSRLLLAEVTWNRTRRRGYIGTISLLQLNAPLPNLSLPTFTSTCSKIERKPGGSLTSPASMFGLGSDVSHQIHVHLSHQSSSGSGSIRFLLLFFHFFFLGFSLIFHRSLV